MNPTHYAVAIRYDDATMNAPRVIAKGADLLAMRIRDVAKASNVPVLQSPMLARALYAHAEIDSEIPAALYTAVAQVLAYVYQLKASLKGKGAAPAADAGARGAAGARSAPQEGRPDECPDAPAAMVPAQRRAGPAAWPRPCW